MQENTARIQFVKDSGEVVSLDLTSDAYLLYSSNSLRDPILQEVIRALHLPLGSRGLDVGCGIGLQALHLAQAVGQTGHITGLDSSEAFLELAGKFAGQSNLAERVSFRQGDWNELPFENGAFDWVWSADAAGYADREPGRVYRELARMVKPGGSLAVLFWSAQTLLPGYPALEARLNATRAGTAPFDPGMRPEAHPLRALGWLRQAGLVEPRAETFVGSAFAPLDDKLREALAVLLDMRWGGAEPDLAPEDWSTYRRLCLAGSPDFILDNPDYYAFFTYSLFTARVPGQARIASGSGSERPAVYEIRLQGSLPAAWSDWFGGMQLHYEAQGSTTLTGPVADQATLYGLLDRVRDLGIPLLSLKQNAE